VSRNDLPWWRGRSGSRMSGCDAGPNMPLPRAAKDSRWGDTGYGYGPSHGAGIAMTDQQPWQGRSGMADDHFTRDDLRRDTYARGARSDAPSPERRTSWQVQGDPRWRIHKWPDGESGVEGPAILPADETLTGMDWVEAASVEVVPADQQKVRSRGGNPPTAEQEERAKWRANERADRAEAQRDQLAERVRVLEAGLREVFNLAAVSWEGDPWYARARDLLSAEPRPEV
jgi:hypothetical protein